jgi:hypothetical protein
MKSTSIEYTYSVNNGYVTIITDQEGLYEFKETKSYMGDELDYITSEELIEIGQWLITLGKGDK